MRRAVSLLSAPGFRIAIHEALLLVVVEVGLSSNLHPPPHYRKRGHILSTNMPHNDPKQFPQLANK